jgi:hypothetical protein
MFVKRFLIWRTVRSEMHKAYTRWHATHIDYTMRKTDAITGRFCIIVVRMSNFEMGSTPVDFRKDAYSAFYAQTRLVPPDGWSAPAHNVQLFDHSILCVAQAQLTT